MAAAKMSPTMEAIDFCIAALDENSWKVAAAGINRLMREGVGVPTKVFYPLNLPKAGCAQVIVTIAMRFPALLEKDSGVIESLVRSMLQALQDRSPAVRTSYATALGYSIRFASAECSQKVLTQLRSFYLEKPGLFF